MRTLEEPHTRLFGGPTRLPVVAGVTRSHDIFPDRLSTLYSRNDVIVVELLHGELLPAIAALEVVASHHVDA